MILRFNASYLPRPDNHTPGSPFWQRNYYGHIIRYPEELDQIRVYIQDDPRNHGNRILPRKEVNEIVIVSVCHQALIIDTHFLDISCR